MPSAVACQEPKHVLGLIVVSLSGQYASDACVPIPDFNAQYLNLEGIGQNVDMASEVQHVFLRLLARLAGRDHPYRGLASLTSHFYEHHNMNNLQEKGRALYKRGEYKEAIVFFDRAIGHASSVQLLDNRAACHEKLNNLQAALKDAKAAIQLHREDATGYLRAGKVLIKMEKESVALEIYTHGLKCIKHVGQGYEHLRKVHIELMTKLCPPKSVDPMTMLPRELAEIILEHLTFRQRMNACLVSKQWAKFIRSCPDLWRHLDLSNSRKKVKNAFISRAVSLLYDFSSWRSVRDVFHCEAYTSLLLLGRKLSCRH